MHISLDGNVRPMYKGTMHLSDYMAENHLSDEDVAKVINRSRPTVSRIRRKLVRPDWQTIEKIKEFTNGASTADDYQSLESAQ
jgi:transcriptional regulator with XRE-family HTH domain